MSIASEITRLQNAKSNLKSKLQNKGVLVGNERLDEMVNLVDNIQGGSGTDTTDATATANDILKGKTAYTKDGKVEGTIETYNLEMSEGAVNGNTLKNLLDATKSAYYLFNNYQGDNLSDLIQYNDTENVIKFSYMYYNCSNATTFPQLNTSNGTDFNYMYYDCSNATSFPQLNTINAIRFSYMYYGCDKATTFPQLNTSNGTDFSYMYSGCKKVKKIDISRFRSIDTNSSKQICNGCYSLKAFIIRSFGDTYVLDSGAFRVCYHILGTTNATYNPNGDQDGYIYVPRNMIETLSSATNWSTVATQFRALEDYTKDGTTTGEFDDEKAGI